jgi:MotA/TolQ/ExbB proton channel family
MPIARIACRTGVLATIGGTAPFVGLFGTVSGIMGSFIGIPKAHTMNLAVVTPGIAEALLATALGLVAAVPAVMIYNVLARSTTHYRALIGDASEPRPRPRQPRQSRLGCQARLCLKGRGVSRGYAARSKRSTASTSSRSSRGNSPC